MSLITFTFPKSRIKAFQELLNRAESFTLSGCDPFTIEIESATEILENWPDFMVVATVVPKIKGARAWFMGEDVLPFTSDFFLRFKTLCITATRTGIMKLRFSPLTVIQIGDVSYLQIQQGFTRTTFGQWPGIGTAMVGLKNQSGR